MQLKKVSLSKQRYRQHTGWFNIAFHKFEDILYDHKQVKHVNTYWSEKSVIYSTSKLIHVANFLGHTDCAYMLTWFYIVSTIIRTTLIGILNKFSLFIP
jgi:hypothetical protein